MSSEQSDQTTSHRKGGGAFKGSPGQTLLIKPLYIAAPIKLSDPNDRMFQVGSVGDGAYRSSTSSPARQLPRDCELRKSGLVGQGIYKAD